MARQKEKKKRKEHTKDASIVFAEIEAKLPADLVIHRSENYANVVVHNAYWSTEYPTYIKKEKRIVKGKQLQQYAIAHWLGNLFGATSCYKKSEDALIQQDVRIFNEKGGEDLFKSMYEVEESKHIRTHEPEEEDFPYFSVILSGAAVVETTEPQKKPEPKQEIYYDAIGLSKNFTKYAGVTPTVYFRYVNYRMREAFRQPEDTDFILKNCLEYKGGCRLNKEKERSYYQERNFLLKLWKSDYKTLAPFFLNIHVKNKTQRRKSVIALIKNKYHLNTVYRNNLLKDNVSNTLTNIKKTKEDVYKTLERFNSYPSGLLSKIIYSNAETKCNIVLHEKKTQKLRFDQLDVEKILDRYVAAVVDIWETVVCDVLTDYILDIDKIIHYKSVSVRAEGYENYENLTYIKPFQIPQTLLDYISLSHKVEQTLVVDMLKDSLYYVGISTNSGLYYQQLIIKVNFEIENKKENK